MGLHVEFCCLSVSVTLAHTQTGQLQVAAENPTCCLRFRPISEKHISIYVHPVMPSKAGRFYKAYLMLTVCSRTCLKRPFSRFFLSGSSFLIKEIGAGKGSGMVTSVPQKHRKRVNLR